MAFPDTQWTLIANATLAGDPAGREALDALFRRYQAPVLKFIELRVGNTEAAKDLSQSFWLHLLEKRTWRQAEMARGRFRTFLLSVLTNFLNDRHRMDSAEKRGGNVEHQAFEMDAEVDNVIPHVSQEFDREWAECLLKTALTELEASYEKAGKGGVYAVIRAFLPGATATPTYEAAAASASISTDALRVEIHRMRQRLREMLRRAIAQTVTTPDQVDEELGYLRNVLSRSR